MRTLTNLIIAIEESKNIEELKVVALQGSLETHEQTLVERSTKKPVEQALQAQTSRRGGYGEEDKTTKGEIPKLLSFQIK